MQHTLCKKSGITFPSQGKCFCILKCLKSKCHFYRVCVVIEELHAEACYAECLLQRAALTFLQVGRDWRFQAVTFLYTQIAPHTYTVILKTTPTLTCPHTLSQAS